jgi:predicted ATPase
VATAHTHLQAVAAIGDTQRLQTYIFPTGQDLRVLGLTYDAMTLWVLGYPEQALERSRRALNIAEEVAQPWALAMALGYAALVHTLRGDLEAAMERVEATIRLATEQEVLPWVGRGVMLRGWALAEQGQETAGLAQLQEGLAAWQANGQELGKPFWLGLLGAGYAQVGQVGEGSQVIAEALAMAQTRELRVWEAELHRLQGELLLQQAAIGRDLASPAEPPQSPKTSVRATGPLHRLDAAEACFRQALELARRQQAKSLELRATMSLSRLWQQQGKKQAARQRLEESYHWFTEGFETADLRRAKVLLQELEG